MNQGLIIINLKSKYDELLSSTKTNNSEKEIESEEII